MSKQNTVINPPSRNVADMLEILANPDEYRKHLAELRTTHKELEARIGIYNTLEKVRAFEKEVKLEAADAAKVRTEANKLWTKLEQSSKDLADRKAALDEYKVELDEIQVENAKVLSDEQSKLTSSWADHEQAVATLELAKAKLRADHAKHDARVMKAKDKLAAVVTAIKGVESL